MDIDITETLRCSAFQHDEGLLRDLMRLLLLSALISRQADMLLSIAEECLHEPHEQRGAWHA